MAIKAAGLAGAFLIFVATGAGCDMLADKAAGSCDWRGSGGDRCFEYPKSEVATAKAGCTGGKTWKDGLCDRTGSLGGCSTGAGTTKWIYPVGKYKTREDASVECISGWLGPDGKPIK